VFRENISGASADRPRLRKLLAAVTHGDVVIVPAVAAAQIMRATGAPARPVRG
jgi:DNA invertase Pin-like site-specific DNA recombinase